MCGKAGRRSDAAPGGCGSQIGQFLSGLLVRHGLAAFDFRHSPMLNRMIPSRCCDCAYEFRAILDLLQNCFEKSLPTPYRLPPSVYQVYQRTSQRPLWMTEVG